MYGISTFLKGLTNTNFSHFQRKAFSKLLLPFNFFLYLNGWHNLMKITSKLLGVSLF